MLKIGNLDITSCVQEKTYSMRSTEETKSFKDGNGILHKRLIRKRIIGSFEAVFVDGLTVAYNDYLTALNGATDSEGRVTVTASVTNLNEDKEILCYIEEKPSGPIKVSDNVTIFRSKFTLEEC